MPPFDTIWFMTPKEAIENAMHEEWDTADWVLRIGAIIVGVVVIGFIRYKFGV